MGMLADIRAILVDILDLDDEQITAETYIVRELGAESIDLLELAVSLNARFKVEVNDGEIFLLRLREHISEAESQAKDVVQYLGEKLSFLSRDRIEEIVNDLEGGPTLKVKDLVGYISWKTGLGLAQK